MLCKAIKQWLKDGNIKAERERRHTNKEQKNMRMSDNEKQEKKEAEKTRE